MRFSTLIIGLFAPSVLAFPFVAKKRAANAINDVYHYATVIVTVTSFVTPDAVDSNTVDPNTVNPNTVNPNTVNPNTVNPNTVNPNTVTPNTVNPNTINPNTANSNTVNPNISWFTYTTKDDSAFIRHRPSIRRHGSPTPTVNVEVLPTAEPFTIETAPPTSTSASVSFRPILTGQASSIVTNSGTSKTDADDPLPSTFVPDLDPADPIYKGLTLQHHNIHRRNHSAADLTWNDTLAGYAETIAKTCIYDHSNAAGDGDYGQNIAGGYEAGNITQLLTNRFYNDELLLYPEFGTNFPNWTNFEGWAHFTQMVWKSTVSVGCYTNICSPPDTSILRCKPDGTSYLSKLPCGLAGNGVPAVFTVCNYYPAGNVVSEFLNVGPPLNGPTVFVNGDGVQGL